MLLIAMLIVAVMQTSGVSRAQLENFTYQLGDHASVEGGKVPLTAGHYKDPEGSSFTLHKLAAFGDLDGDKRGDAVAIVVEATGGTGSFYYLFAVAGRDGQLQQLGEPEWLGDRTVVERLAIDASGVITVRYITHDDNDPSCCPTMKITDRYRVRDGKLVGIVK